MAIIDGSEDEVDKMMWQLKNVDNNPLQRYYSEQLEINPSTKFFHFRMTINAEVFDYKLDQKMEYVKIEKKVKIKRVEHKSGYP